MYFFFFFSFPLERKSDTMKSNALWSEETEISDSHKPNSVVRARILVLSIKMCLLRSFNQIFFYAHRLSFRGCDGDGRYVR